jgi:formyltetrahydrofolate deformylase
VADSHRSQEHCLYDLLVRYRAKELACEIAMVVSNHRDAEPIAQHFGVPFRHLPVTPETKAEQETAAIELLEQERVDLIVLALARYMQILSPELVARFPSRIINIHHSFLPAFVGANPYRQAFTRFRSPARCLASCIGTSRRTTWCCRGRARSR